MRAILWLFAIAFSAAHAQSDGRTPPPAVAPAAAPSAAAPSVITPPTIAASAVPDNQTAVSADSVPVLMQAERETTLSSQMAGKIKAINFSIGQSFRQGQLLIEFDCAEQQARLDSSQAELLGATQTHLAKLKLQGLGAAGELEVTLAAAAVEKARATVREQEAQMALCRVPAPYDGRVARLRAKPFESVAQGQPLLEIVSQSGLKAVMHVPSEWLSWLRIGTPVQVRLNETGINHPGRVSKLNSRVDAVSQTLEIEATIDTKSANVLPGMIGTASFPVRAAPSGGTAPSRAPAKAKATTQSK
jgi:RND family efflux transporter MFP subunit